MKEIENKPQQRQEAAEEQENPVLVLDSAKAMTTPVGAGSDLASKINGREDEKKSADQLLNAPGQFELVSANGDQLIKTQAPNPEDVQKGIRALLGDALKGEKWSQDSVDTFNRIFKEESSLPNASPESIARALNTIGGAINNRVSPELANHSSRRPEPVGMGVVQNPDGSYSYYMTLNKDNAALAANRLSIISGQSSDTVIKLGPFKKGTAI